MLHESPRNADFEEINDMDIDIEQKIVNDTKQEIELERIQNSGLDATASISY